MLCIKIIYFLTQTTCTTVVVFEPRGQGSQFFFDACINQIGVEIHLATVTSPFHSGCFGLASPELAKGAIAYRLHSEKLIRSPAN